MTQLLHSYFFRFLALSIVCEELSHPSAQVYAIVGGGGDKGVGQKVAHLGQILHRVEVEETAVAEVVASIKPKENT